MLTRLPTAAQICRKEWSPTSRTLRPRSPGPTGSRLSSGLAPLAELIEDQPALFLAGARRQLGTRSLVFLRSIRRVRSVASRSGRSPSARWPL